MTTRSDITMALDRVDTSLVSSGYASSLIKHKDDNFVDYLSRYLTPGEKDQLIADPNSMVGLLEDLGYAFYNHFYLGNPGYETTLFGY